MQRIAIPSFKSRVSPVFDTCARLLLFDMDKNQVIGRTEISLEGLSKTDRLKILKNSGVSTIICGGISDNFYKMISFAGISLVIGIAGEVNQVFDAYRCNRLGESCFYMPGYKNPGD